MKWVTREHVHLDRVACPWLIKRFIDKEAEFVFVPWGKEDQRPQDAIPFALPGVELGPHDEHGTTFEKILRKYKLQEPALAMMGQIVASGVHYALHKGPKDEAEMSHLEGVGLNSLSEGLMLITQGDHDNIDKSMPVYDAFYAFCLAHIMVAQDATLAQKPLLERSGLLKSALADSLPR